MNKLFITVFGIGLIPKIGNSLAILFALIIGVTIIKVYDNATLLFILTFFWLLGIYGTEKYIKITNEHDPDLIVIDEVVGVWFTLYVAHVIMPVLDTPLTSANFSETTAFIIFVFLGFFSLNLYKPGLIGMVTREGDAGLSVMGDDLITGFFAGLMANFFMAFFYAFDFWLKL